MDWQFIAVLLVVVLAAFFVARRFRRDFKGEGAGCGCGSSCGCDSQAVGPEGTCGECAQAAQCNHEPRHAGD